MRRVYINAFTLIRWERGVDVEMNSSFLILHTEYGAHEKEKGRISERDFFPLCIASWWVCM